MDEIKKRKFVIGGLVVIILIMMVQNFFLVRKTDALAHKLEDVNASMSERRMLAEGDTVHSFKAFGLDGKGIIINPRKVAGKTLFFAFSTSCGACRKNVEQWNWIAKQSTKSNVSITGVCPDSLDRIKEFASSCGITFSVFSIVNDSLTQWRLKLDIFPQTILIDSTGRVVDDWGGLLSDKRSKDVLLSL